MSDKHFAQSCFDKVCEFYGGDVDKTWKFFKSANPNLGNKSPLEMIRLGRTKKLFKYIDTAINENYRLD